MKKFMSLALCLAAIGSMNAQKATVDAANKLAGKPDKITEARNLIKEALQNPETANDARTYYVGGKVEMDAFDKNTAALMINPNAGIDVLAMGEELLNAYNNWMKAMELDQLPNEKGQVKPRFTKEIKGKIAGHANDFSKSGADFYNAQRYYPEAYTLFMVTGDLPQYGVNMADTTAAMYYDYAGISAFLAEKFDAAADAFHKSRLAGSNNPDTYINEINAWRRVSEADSARTAEADQHIWEGAHAGFEKFGMENSTFLIHLVNESINKGQKDEAIAIIKDAMAKYPDSADAPGILGNTYERLGDMENADLYYRQAIANSNVSPNVLYSAATFLYRMGSQKNNEIDPGQADAANLKKLVRDNYVTPGLEIIERIRTIDPRYSGLDDAEENLNYLGTLAK